MKFIAMERIDDFLAGLARDASLWMPVLKEDSGGTVLFDEWQPGASPVLNGYTTLSPKQLLLPATEKLFGFRYRFAGGKEQLEVEPGEKATEGRKEASHGGVILFGSRACDAKAITVLDALFSLPPGEAYNDPQYRGKRYGLAVVTIACTSSDAACFCSSFENGPAEKAGSDVFLYPVPGGYLAEVITEKGGQLIDSGSFEESSLEPPKLAETARIDPSGLDRKLMDIFPDLDFWEKVSEKCLSCGYCTYCCPTCYCFDVFDEMRSDREGERLRAWDSCMFHLYTQEASGHNPRPKIAHRYRNRINHKFSYYPANQGEILCTGCGRCIRGCPAGLDIRDVLIAAGQYQKKEASEPPENDAEKVAEGEAR